MPIHLSPSAYALAAHLHARLRGRWQALPGANTGQSTVPPFQAAPIPENLRGRRVELIVEASDLRALNSALASKADAVVVDFDDTFAPTPANVQAAYDALAWVMDTEKPLLARPRALYATEPGLDFGGPASAALCDLAVLLTARPDRVPHLYLPKLETEVEARFWQEALSLAETHLGLEANTVRVCLQIETFSGLLNADILLHVLRSRAYGLNAGRWDYVFSLIKHIGATRPGPVPPRSQLTMDVPAMRAYAEHLVGVCQQHGAEAIGGTASLAPDPANPQPALEAVQADKEREATQGFTAAWAGLPDLLDAVRAGIAPRVRRPSTAVQADLQTILTDLPTPNHIPVLELRDSVGLALDVFAAWLEGRGVVVRGGRVEDTATAELARALVWQWVRVGATLDDGSVLTRDRYRMERRALMPDNVGAARLLDHLVLSDRCAAYFPREAQGLFPDLFQGVTS
ncbi:aldolase/citrate lyase family protein [Deinococcus sp. KSM4-11]|uniref:aldolase/citrate lyase family protein n=1 Tax=Deinococcus sp. KSM4-11 TaxID=2568654 RepID=UPI001F114434|nr:aldolase/citrate lyase family protein [Deinococcus sp. KSM4-11]